MTPTISVESVKPLGRTLIANVTLGFGEDRLRLAVVAFVASNGDRVLQVPADVGRSGHRHRNVELPPAWKVPIRAAVLEAAGTAGISVEGIA